MPLKPAKLPPAKLPQVKLPPIRNKTAEQVQKISDTLKEAYAKGRRFRKVGFNQSGLVK